MNNTKQLMLACHMYLGDNEDSFPKSRHGGGSEENQGSWVTGSMTWGNHARNFRLDYLLDDRYSKLGPYFAKAKNLFKCPSDKYITPAQVKWFHANKAGKTGWTSEPERVRSISGNIRLGDDTNAWGARDYPNFTRKMSGLTDPGPSQTWVYMDEHPDSINDVGNFTTEMEHGNPWTDLPANYHNGAAGIAFADGHSEIHKWTASMLTVPRCQYTNLAGRGRNGTYMRKDADALWWALRTQRKDAGAEKRIRDSVR